MNRAQRLLDQCGVDEASNVKSLFDQGMIERDDITTPDEELNKLLKTKALKGADDGFAAAYVTAYDRMSDSNKKKLFSALNKYGKLEKHWDSFDGGDDIEDDEAKEWIASAKAKLKIKDKGRHPNLPVEFSVMSASGVEWLELFNFDPGHSQPSTIDMDSKNFKLFKK